MMPPDEPTSELPAYDRVSLTLRQACERYLLPPQVVRWRIHRDMTPHFMGDRQSRLIVRFAESERWHLRADELGLTRAAHIPEWPQRSIMEGVEEQPVVYSFVSCSMRQAVDRTGVSEATLHKAISDGWLVAHYVGERGGKIVIRAQDLDEWVKSLPTESRREQEWRSIYH
ncbi:MAG TPA: helix-turn-helix domain-containing protein [Propionicimonas sp.]